MDKNKICRLCLTRPPVSYSLLDKNGAIILESLTSIKVHKDDNLPKRACVKCWLNIKLAYQIQQNILEADEKLRAMDFENEVNCKNSPMKIELNGIEIIHQIEEDTDIEGCSLETEIIKVENLTDEDLLVCQVNENKDNVMFSEDKLESTSKTTCRICGTSIEEDVLIEHMNTHYSSRLKCEECGTYCENIKSYREHIQSVHKDMQQSWTCSICLLSFYYKPLYNIHIEKAHGKDNSNTLKRVGIPSRWIKIISSDRYKYDCPYCKKRFQSEKKSLLHIQTHSKKECKICGAKISPSNYKVHVDSHSSPPIVCHLCGVTYKNPTSLRSHIHYTHSTRTYSCEFCKNVYKKSYDLLLHVKKEHTGEKNHVCDICGKSFFAFYNLNKHKKMTHMKLRPFQCQYCKKTFSSKHSLRTHERQHTNITPYSCEVCGEGFRQNVSLKAHKKSKHNIVEPKTCECKVCGKKFGTKWAVLSHMRLHI